MTVLAHLAAALVPTQRALPAEPDPDALLRQVLGHGRLAAAAELRDADRTDALVDALLDHEWLGRRIAARVGMRAIEALTS